MLLHVLILDFWLYWWHRINHQWSLLWRFHRIHHLDSWLDTTSALRFHFGEVLLSAVARLPVILLLGISFTSVLAYEAVILLCAIFHHSNIRLPLMVENGLSKLIITPGIHWVHHHAIRRDTDSNYGTLFSFWDRLFATRSSTVRFSDMPIGVEAEPEQKMGHLLLMPVGVCRT